MKTIADIITETPIKEWEYYKNNHGDETIEIPNVICCIRTYFSACYPPNIEVNGVSIVMESDSEKLINKKITEVATYKKLQEWDCMEGETVNKWLLWKMS